MINYIQPGDTLPLVAPYAVASGAGVKVGSLFGVACNAAMAGAPVEVKRTGCFVLPCVPADVLPAGGKVYWDDTAKTCTATAGTNMLVGAAIEAKAAAVTSVRVSLDGIVR